MKYCYQNSRLKPRRLTTKRNDEIRKEVYHHKGGSGGSQGYKIWWEDQRDDLLRHIDWQQQEIAKQLRLLMEYDNPVPFIEQLQARRESMTQNEIIAEVAQALGVTL